MIQKAQRAVNCVGTPFCSDDLEGSSANLHQGEIMSNLQNVEPNHRIVISRNPQTHHTSQNTTRPDSPSFPNQPNAYVPRIPYLFLPLLHFHPTNPTTCPGCDLPTLQGLHTSHRSWLALPPTMAPTHTPHHARLQVKYVRRMYTVPVHPATRTRIKKAKPRLAPRATSRSPLLSRLKFPIPPH